MQDGGDWTSMEVLKRSYYAWFWVHIIFPEIVLENLQFKKLLIFLTLALLSITSDLLSGTVGFSSWHPSQWFILLPKHTVTENQPLLPPVVANNFTYFYLFIIQNVNTNFNTVIWYVFDLESVETSQIWAYIADENLGCFLTASILTYSKFTSSFEALAMFNKQIYWYTNYLYCFSGCFECL